MSTATSSRIKAACSCGKKYLARAEHSGKQCKCKCGKVFTVPTQEKAEAAIPEKECPTCSARIGPEEIWCKACEREAVVSEAKAEADVSLARTIGIATVCGLIVVVAGIYQSQLKASGFLIFFVLLGVLCAISIIAARLLGISKRFVRELTIAALVSYGVIALIRCVFVLSDVRAPDSFELLLLLAVLGPLIVCVIAFLDAILLEFYEPETSASGAMESWWNDPKIRIAGGFAAATVLVGAIYQTQLDGPQFVKFYFALGVGICIAFLIARLTSCPTVGLIILLLAFEAIGAIRFGYGVTQGMHKFGNLGSMMILGPMGFAFVSGVGQASGSQGSGSSCSSGSSCGGGGCGGGGCGGCGG